MGLRRLSLYSWKWDWPCQSILAKSCESYQVGNQPRNWRSTFCETRCFKEENLPARFYLLKFCWMLQDQDAKFSIKQIMLWLPALKHQHLCHGTDEALSWTWNWSELLFDAGGIQILHCMLLWTNKVADTDPHKSANILGFLFISVTPYNHLN